MLEPLATCFKLAAHLLFAMRAHDDAVVNWLASTLRILLRRVECLEANGTQVKNISLFDALYAETNVSEPKKAVQEQKVQTNVSEPKEAVEEQKVQTNVSEPKEVVKKQKVQTNVSEPKKAVEEQKVQTNASEPKEAVEEQKVQTVVSELKEAVEEQKVQTNVSEPKRAVEEQKVQTNVIEPKEVVDKQKVQTNVSEPQEVVQIKVEKDNEKVPVEVIKARPIMSEHPPSAYQLYVSTCYDEPEAKDTNIGIMARNVSNGWASLTEEEKFVFKTRALEISQNWQHEQKHWLKQSNPSIFVYVGS